MKEYFWNERGIAYKLNDWQEGRTTIVFIHGVLGSSSAWWQFERLFKDRYNILSVDLPGYGKSLKPNEYDAYGIERVASLINELMDILKVTSYIPIAASEGTVIALALLRQRPEGARHVIFMSPMYGMQKSPIARATRWLVRGATKIFQLFNYSPNPGTHIDYEPYKKTTDWSASRLSADISDNTLRVFAYSLDNMLSRNFDAWWHQMAIPTLLIHGTHDTINPIKNIEPLRTHPHMTVHSLKGGDHVMPLNRFDEVQKIVSDYLKKFDA